MHARRLSTFLALIAAFAAFAALPAGAGAAQPGVVLPNPTLGDGTLQRLQASGAKHVRVFASWRMLESQRGRFETHIIAGYDDLANRLKAMGIGVYFVVTQTPAWATASGAQNAAPPPGPYADFLRRLAERYKGRVMGYEVWNEPNDVVFWQGGATPATYTALLRPAYAAVKAADPAAKVGVAGLIGNDYKYLEGMYQAGAKGSFDFVGIHTDGQCGFTDPREAARDVDGRISRWSFTGYREVRATMLAHGDPKPIWMTEIGWQVTGRKCPQVPKDPGGVSAAAQAAFLTHAYACLANDPYVEMASWFSLADFGAHEDTGGGYGLYTFSGAPRPSLATFQRAGAVGADARCGLKVDSGGAGVDVAYPTGVSGVSGDLRFKGSASDDQGIRTLAVLVDGRQIKVTSKKAVEGTWTGWRKLAFGPHTVTFRAVDAALNVSEKAITVNRVPYGDGEPVRTRIAVGLYGSGKSRIAAGTLFTRPAEAKPFVRGHMTIAFERKAGTRWRPFGGAAGGPVARAVQRTRKFKPGRYRVIVSFAGHKSFKPAVSRRSFTIR
jgi:cellulase (glycosyl hydrolase family 5)